MRTLITGGTIVNEGRAFRGQLIIRDESIEWCRPLNGIISSEDMPSAFDRVIDATGCYVLPGVIDDHVHFREPGLTAKADIDSESAAAAAGGVTTFFDMPNTVPQTVTLETLDEKFRLAKANSHVNYSFFFGATNDNWPLFKSLDVRRLPGIKLFMGSSTGNMLVDREEALNRIFASTPLPLMAHCEDTTLINENMRRVQEAWGDDPPVEMHPLIRSEEACLASAQKAVALAHKHQTRLHVAHVSTAEELELFLPVSEGDAPWPLVTAEATVGHLFFTMLDHARLGTRIKVNPAIKSPVDQFMLRQALIDGRIAVIGTDHAPHQLAEKEGGCRRAASGMPSVQFALPAMLELVDQGVLPIERLVTLMCHHPARLFGVEHRGYLREGYQADVVVVRPHGPWTVDRPCILSKCGWSPMEGHTFQWRVERTFCNGHEVYDGQTVDRSYTGQEVRFHHANAIRAMS